MNLSETGALIRTADNWSRGTIIELTLQREAESGDRSASSRVAVHLPTKVVRSDSRGMAVQFLFIAPAERLGVREFLATINARQAENGGGAGSKGSGQALIEFALVLPLLFLLIMNLVNFGAFLYAGITVADAARSGAQYMVLAGASLGAPAPPATAAVVAVVTQDVHSLPNRASLLVKVCTKNNGVLACSGSGGVAPPNDPEPTHYVVGTVDVTYTYLPIIPAWNFPALGIHLTLPPSTIHRQAAMRMLQ